jgi:hypothetical protein
MRRRWTWVSIEVAGFKVEGFIILSFHLAIKKIKLLKIPLKNSPFSKGGSGGIISGLC